MKFLFLLLLPVLVAPVFAEQQPTDQGTLLVNLSTEPENPIPQGETKIKRVIYKKEELYTLLFNFLFNFFDLISKISVCIVPFKMCLIVI